MLILGLKGLNLNTVSFSTVKLDKDDSMGTNVFGSAK